MVRQLSTAANTVFLDLSLDWRVLGFTAAVAITTAVLFGTAPALRATRLQPNDALKAQGRGVMGDGRLRCGPSAHRPAGRAVTCNRRGCRPAHPNVFVTRGPGPWFRQPSRLGRFGGEIPTPESTRPDALNCSVSCWRPPPQFRVCRLRRCGKYVPFGGNTWNNLIELPDGPPMPESERLTSFNMLSTGWFETYTAHQMLAGRDFTQTPTRRALRSMAIVNDGIRDAIQRRQKPRRDARASAGPRTA